jgi:dihydrodipicolinate synthase/N-acetylneuraminate lyase
VGGHPTSYLQAHAGHRTSYVLVLGSSSEVAFLPGAQRHVVVETTVDQVAGRVPVLVGCIDMTTLRVEAGLL